jgi:hypothetical protein
MRWRGEKGGGVPAEEAEGAIEELKLKITPPRIILFATPCPFSTLSFIRMNE